MRKILAGFICAATLLSGTVMAAPTQIHITETADEVLSADTYGTASFYADFEEGNGTKASPYIISNAEQLLSIASVVENTSEALYFELACNIDLAGAEWTPIGTASAPFNGGFNGNGYTVSNLKITKVHKYSGFFGVVKEADICKLSIENMNISFDSTSTSIIYAGLLFGRAYKGEKDNNTTSTFSEISVSGSIDVEHSSTIASTVSSAYVGGIAGEIKTEKKGNYIIKNCISLADITVVSTTGNAYGGGIVGSLQDTISAYEMKIEKSYYHGSCSAEAKNIVYAGGIAGLIKANNNFSSWYGDSVLFANEEVDYNITNCFVSGSVTASSDTSDANIGRIHGAVHDQAEIKNCAYVATQTISAVAAGQPYTKYTGSPSRITTLSSTYLSNTLGFDMTNTWALKSGDTFPSLSCLTFSSIERINVIYDANGGDNTPFKQTAYKDSTITLGLAMPTKAGYTFKGWSTSKTGNVEYNPGDKYVASENLFLYAVWEANEYVVQYNSNGGLGEMSDTTFVYDQTNELSENTFEKTGYNFLGWATNSSAVIPDYTDKQSVSNLTSVDGKTITLYAVWNANTYTVQYNSNGGSGVMSDTTFVYNKTNELSENTFEKTGYNFLGWATDSSATVPDYTDKQSVSNLTSADGEIITLYAVWEIKKYTITYNANGGENAPDKFIKTHDVDIAISSDTPARTGYNFLGWSTIQNGNVEYSSGANYTDNVNTTLYAVWNAIEYSIKYNGNGGSGEMSDTTFVYDKTIELSENTFEKTGYNFLGWATDSSATVTNYTNKQSVTNLTSVDGETITLYAVWEANTYTVQYNSNGGSGEMLGTEFVYDKTNELSENTFEKTGYKFIGWATSATAETHDYTDMQSVSNLTTVDGETITLYAVWKANEYTVEYNKNGGIGQMSSSTFVYDQFKELSANTFEKSNYTFLGWALDPNAVKPDFAENESVKNLTAIDQEIVTLYAVWRPDEYTIIYNGNGGENTPSDQTKYHDTDITLSNVIPEYKGFEFLGWSTTPVGEVEYLNGATFTANTNITLYAVWGIKYGDINIDGNINSEDIRLLAEFLAGNQTTINFTRANVRVSAADSETDLSSNLDIMDLILLAQYISGKNVTLG